MPRKNRKTDISDGDYNRYWLVKEIAERAGFIQEDIDVVLRTLQEVMTDIISEKKILKVNGLFTMYLTEKTQKNNYDIKNDVYRELPPAYYVSFKASKSLLNKLPERKRDYNDDE